MAYKPGRCLLTVRLRELRKSQTWLAEQTGILKSQISDYANNRRTMSLATAMTIAAAIGCYIDDLYERIEVSSK
ncbi:helix-turn-helix transcriptional regulator [Paenibacillus sp. PDC88]|uniref:helix-turn-helix domain-containing protein n=1 Tax=Paenibacillus sp. PDC88 TaxID=1884375 RepID=UPI00089C4E40|nr:helix-turn-helix transcriptional regulator [Paenibacillus sp. PDC88]SDX04439.1 Cro/C1-type HTH DNA-binding domain-containing protein [Paenibacillus sp. PDC88]